MLIKIGAIKPMIANVENISWMKNYAKKLPYKTEIEYLQKTVHNRPGKHLHITLDCWIPDNELHPDTSAWRLETKDEL